MSDTIHSLIGAYAVDALEPDERAQVERHLEACDECREDLASFRDAVTSLGDAEAVAPPASLRGRVFDEASRTSQLPPSSDTAPRTDPIRVAESFGHDDGPGTAGRRDSAPPHSGEHADHGADELAPPRGRVRRWWPAFAGAAATVAVAAVGLGVSGVLSGGSEAQVAMEKDVMMVASAPDAQSMDMDLGNSHVVTSERMDAVAIMGKQAPMPDKGTEYQVWLILEDGSKVAGPTFMPDDDGEYMAYVPSDLDGVVAVAITCEPPGGSAEPTTDVVSTVDL